MSNAMEQMWEAARASDMALLAAVPYEHLVSAVTAFPPDAEIAFGTDAVDALVNLTARLDGGVCPALIYASMSPDSGPPRVRWTGVFRSYVGGRAGKYAGTALRPPSTASDGPWTTFWTVKYLRRLEPDETILVSKLKGWKKNFYAPEFVPHGPLFIHNPIEVNR